MIETFTDEGHLHVPVGTDVVYSTDPPTSGNHYPEPQQGGFFQTPIGAGYLVHSMEHGGVIIYYNPAMVTDAERQSLQTLAALHPGVFSQVVCVPRDDPTYPIILTAWTHRLRLPIYDQNRIDGFVTLYLGQGPESMPATPWDDPSVSNATATSTFTGFAWSLAIAGTARPGSASTSTVMAYLAEAVTFTVDVELSALSALSDFASIRILESPTAAVLAEAVYDASTGMISFRIGDVVYPGVAVSTGGFHNVRFIVDADHYATWSVDGTATYPALPFGSPTVRLGIGATYADGGGDAPGFSFGNLFVNHP